MVTGRIPAQCVESFDGRHNTLSSISNESRVKTISHGGISQCISSTNLNKHYPFAPKLFIIPAKHKPRAKVVQETDKRLKQAYAKPKSSLKTLQFHDESGNQVRSERREAAISLLQVMNHYQDDSTGRIGRFQDSGTFSDMSIKKLAEHAGIQIKRAKRAMADIVQSGYMKVTRQFIRNKETGEVKGIPSIRSFLPTFFTDLDIKGDLWTKIFIQRGWAQKRDEKKINKQQRKKSHAVIGMVKDMMNNTIRKSQQLGSKVKDLVKSVPKQETNKQAEDRIYQEKNLMSKALDMFKIDSSKPISEYYRSLKEAHLAK